MFIFRVLNTVPYTNEAGAKDVIASLHSFFTANLLVGLAVLVSWRQFGGSPIECMVPTDFTSAWVQNYCWAQDTYFLPFSSSVAEDRENREPRAEKVSYYQWMPFFLLFEAACFKLPCLIWKYFASQSGMRVGEILRIASDDQNTVPEVKKGNINALCIHLQGALRFQKRLKNRHLVPHKILRFLNVKYSTYYVVFIYFVAKFAFLVNVGLQAKLLNQYLLPNGTSNHGYDVWRGLWAGNDTWMDTGLFPRVTLCDFEVREMGNIQKHTVQCVLLINLFTEKIFIFLWAWYLVLGALTTCNLFSWIFLMFSETSKEHFIINHLEMCETPFDKNDSKNREHVDRFIDVYLGLDGIFLLQLIAQHADVVFSTELVGALWRSHYAIEEQRKTLKAMELLLPPIRPESSNGMSASDVVSPDAPRIRNPRQSVAALSHSGSSARRLLMQRTVSFDEADRKPSTCRFDSSSDEDEHSGATSQKSSRRMSKA